MHRKAKDKQAHVWLAFWQTYGSLRLPMGMEGPGLVLAEGVLQV